jgi:hypothetical protein
VEIRRTAHFRAEQEADRITEEEVARSWNHPDVDLESQDHPGARVRTATQLDGTKVTVVAHQTKTELIFITTWRQEA